SSNGIGRATAISFARRGAKVTITGRDEKALQATKSECIKAGAVEANLLPIIGDITSEDVQDSLIGETLKKFGSLNVLVNNHGGGFIERDDKGNLMCNVFDKVIGLNCKSTLAMSVKALPHLKATKGCIVNVSSIASTMSAVRHPFYAAAKAALDHITRIMALENASDGVRINAVNPGFVKTEFMKKLGYDDETRNKILKIATEVGVPIGRYGLPEDIAEMIIFLSDNKTAGFITGQTMVVDGGTTLKNAWFGGSLTKELSKF
ncbi:unnamed protein product, partial [Enterobius vermicularis]|uniref:Oxidoreductase n=1 Tax=Enterobius vermicularis TaxID=51028 RepID=A0A0N4VFD2_ENTVE